MFITYNRYTEDLARYVFLEDACWSLINGLGWVLYFDITEFDQSRLKTIYLENKTITSIFYMPCESGNYLLVIFKKKLNINGVFLGLADFKKTSDFTFIFNFVCARDWSKTDFNKTTLIWHPAYQQCVSTLIDSITGGVIDQVPLNWECILRGGELSSLSQEDLKNVKKNVDVFINWCKKHKPTGKFRFSVEFMEWFVGLEEI